MRGYLDNTKLKLAIYKMQSTIQHDLQQHKN